MINPGELAKGQFVTVHHWQWQQVEINPLDSSVEVITVPRTDHSWCGDLLEVIEVMLPYVVVIRRDIPDKRPFKLDTRCAVLMEVKPEYKTALQCPE